MHVCLYVYSVKKKSFLIMPCVATKSAAVGKKGLQVLYKDSKPKKSLNAVFSCHIFVGLEIIIKAAYIRK